MRVRYLTGVAGGQYDGAEGDEKDLPDGIAAEWVRIGYAERVDEPAGETNMVDPEGERAVAPPSGETADRLPGGNRARKRARR